MPLLTASGKPALRELGADCPRLRAKEKQHGSWYYYLQLPDAIDGQRRRPRKGGFLTAKEAEKAAQKLWDEAHQGVDVQNRESVGDYLNRWLAIRVDLKRSTRADYRDFLDRWFLPLLGHLKLRDLRTRHIQAMFEAVWAENKVRESNARKLEEAQRVQAEAGEAWRAAPTALRSETRAVWEAARASTATARQLDRRPAGPGTQKRMLDALSGALRMAVSEKLINHNWANDVIIPRYQKPRALVWTPERVATWKATGRKPSSAMVWTPEQAGRFLDAAADHRYYPIWHLLVFRGPRRGEALGLTWSEVSLDHAFANIVQQLVSAVDGNVFVDTPKSQKGIRTISLDQGTVALLKQWKKAQAKERAAGKAAHRDDPENHPAYEENDFVFTQPNGSPVNPDILTKAFNRFVRRLDVPPVRLHDLRHCAASLSLAAGLPMKAIQNLLGHANYALTADTYTTLMPHMEQGAADAVAALVPRSLETGVQEVPAPIRMQLVPVDREDRPAA
ncbi:tyrosine-type recombinase/integrase (plasmid) [Streptomyces sp. BI20]|uniref:tyrosine-type recombinase/integrase n=1 Tax=Streptomyces sp. BI20 TaxID=3403460 RepID=UPI003C788513